MALLAELFAPASTGPVALVFPPWWSSRQVAEGAAQAGRLIRLGGVGFVAVVMRDSPGGHGSAWLALNPRIVGGCKSSGAPKAAWP